MVRREAHGVGKARFADLPVAQALLRDGIEPVLREREVPGGDEIIHALGEIEEVHAVVDHRKLLHGLKRHRLDEPRGNVEKKKFDLELILNEAHARHRAALLSDIFLIIARFLKFV